MARTSIRKPAAATAARVVLDTVPGHCIRRLQQIAVGLFLQASPEGSVTPVQFAVLHTLSQNPGIDQRTLAREVRLDTSTIGGVIDRLELRGVLTRSHSDGDRRVRLLNLTAEGEQLLVAVTPSMHQAQNRILEPLSAAERKEFMRMMRAVIDHHEA